MLGDLPLKSDASEPLGASRGAELLLLAPAVLSSWGDGLPATASLSKSDVMDWTVGVSGLVVVPMVRCEFGMRNVQMKQNVFQYLQPGNKKADLKVLTWD